VSAPLQPTTVLLWVATALTAAGAWLLLNAVGQGAVALGRRIQLYRQSRHALYVMRVRTGDEPLPDALLYGYPRISWQAFGIGLSVAGFLVLLPFVGLPGALMAVVLERAPVLLRGLLRREGQARLRLRIRDFVDDLREAVAIHGSLGKALDALLVTRTAEADDRDPVALALGRRARTRSAQTSADQVLDQMAADLRSADMREVAAQVRRCGPCSMPSRRSSMTSLTVCKLLIAAWLCYVAVYDRRTCLIP
jgi:hypothetical protein